MFNLSKTFTKDQFCITPILIGSQPVFLPQEIEEQMGYSDLSNSIRHSEGFVGGKDYIVIEGEQLGQLREILRGSQTTLQISPMTRSLALITESGFWGACFRSNKPECVELRIWVTSEVLPSIRKTGSYSAAGGDVDIVKVKRTLSEAKQAAEKLGPVGKLLGLF